MYERSMLPPKTFTLIWVGVVVSYFVCGIVVSAYGLLYFYMLHRAEIVIANVELLGVHAQSSLYPFLGATYLVIALIHFYHFVTMIHHTIKARSLQFSSHSLPKKGLPYSCLSRVGSATLGRVLSPPSSYVGFTVRSLRHFALDLWDAFDITSVNYDVVYVLREIVQTGIQTQQAYMLSAHVAQAWMNHCIVFLLVINCWAMPLITHAFKISSIPTSRMLGLVVNFVLDFVSYFAFPMALFVPYAKDFDPTTGSYELLFWYRDVWIMELKNGWPLVFATSTVDALSRVFMMFSMTRTLGVVAKLVHLSSVKRSVVGLDPRGPRAPSSILPDPKSLHLPESSSRHSAGLISVRALRPRVERWGHHLLALWGLGVLALHIQASSTPTNPQCLLQVRPWFVSRSVCSLMEMNCYDGIMTGNASDFDATLDSIDSEWLAYLIIRHCDAVEITPRIQQLSWLMGVKIHNSTIVQWDADAALTQTHHPHVIFVFIIASNVTVFPGALYHRDFPSQLYDIEFSYVNLTHIPSELRDAWHPGTYLVMEGLQLATFPDVFTELQPSYFSVASNNFTEIPVGVFENPYLVAINLNDNLISELPTGDFKIALLDIMRTKITKIPTWLDTSTQVFEFRAGSTPLCETLHLRNATALGLTSDAELEIWQRLVDCTPVDGHQYLTQFPLGEEPTNNPSTS